VSVRVLVGHVLDRLADLPDECVHCVVTSPPYYGLRSYGTEPQVWGGDPNCQHEWGDEGKSTQRLRNGDSTSTLTNAKRNRSDEAKGSVETLHPSTGAFCDCGAWRGDLGLEPTPELFIAHMVEVFREVRRVMRADATLWINIGDSYESGTRKSRDYSHTTKHGYWNNPAINMRVSGGQKPKDLLMIPAQLALALRADGWWLRSEIVWAKRAPMPESCTDRPTCAHEKIFLLSKSKTYHYDAEAVKEDAEQARFGSYQKSPKTAALEESGTHGKGGNLCNSYPANRNMRNVWHLGPEPFPEAHFATFVSEIPRRVILAGTSAKGVCPKCGAPWVRQVNKTYENPGNRTTNGPRSVENRAITAGFEVRLESRTETIGWHASCSCGPEAMPVPATVCDPFLGAGTTALVADQLGRDCIGIELAPSYAAMSERRVRDDAGMFAQIAAE
jgi:DNA modification methylase